MIADKLVLALPALSWNAPAPLLTRLQAPAVCSATPPLPTPLVLALIVSGPLAAVIVLAPDRVRPASFTALAVSVVAPEVVSVAPTAKFMALCASAAPVAFETAESVVVPLAATLLAPEKLNALPLAAAEIEIEPELAVSAAPESVTAAVFVTVKSPKVVTEPRLSGTLSLSVNDPTVPLVVNAPTALAPLSWIAPAPLAARVPAVSVPAPFRVAPVATETVAVLAPTLSEPERVSAPAETVVAPL